jgi:VanZ family protein
MKMNNNSKFRSKKIINFVKFIFHISNIILIIFYLYPGSIFGCFLYNDCKTQPQLTPDFIVSSNHVYVFTIISLLGFVAYAKNKAFTIIISYFFFIAIFLELAHIIIPERGFEIEDLGGNIVGVIISLIIFLIFKPRKKNGFI